MRGWESIAWDRCQLLDGDQLTGGPRQDGGGPHARCLLSSQWTCHVWVRNLGHESKVPSSLPSGPCSPPRPPQWLGLTSVRPHFNITTITNSRAGRRGPREGNPRKRLRQESTVPTIGIDAVERSGRDDRHFAQAQWALGHQGVFTRRVHLQRAPARHRGRQPLPPPGPSWPAAAGTHHGLAPEAAPVLKAQHAAAGLVTHRALGTHGQVPLQPLVRHGNLRATQRHALGRGRQGVPATTTRAKLPPRQQCSKMGLAEPFFPTRR